MLSNNYGAYITNVIKLTRSLVIKSQHTIEASNYFLTTLGHTVSPNPKEWKYYLNLNGEYYQGNTGIDNDILMTITSLDTQLEIDFTKDNLISSPITFFEYLKYGDYYKELLDRFPTQETLIRGILSPVDIDKAIAAHDYEILSWDTKLVDSNEFSLIKNLQSWINRFTSRWDNISFAISDPLYTTSFLGILFLSIPNVIINLRLEACRTNEVHSFHVWSYLSGYFRLDVYKNRIPHKQALFLYRNIEYINAHVGKKSTLDFLNENFAKPFGLELFSFDINQDSSNKLTRLNNLELNNLNNEIAILRIPYGDDESNADLITILSTTEIVTNLKDLAFGNEVRLLDDIKVLDDSYKKTSFTEIPTGVIECNVVKSVIDSIINKPAVKIHNWFYLASKNLYKYQFNLVVPDADILDVILTAAQAAALLLYSAARYQGVVLTNIPTVLVRDIMFPPTFTEADLKGLVEDEYLNSILIYNTGQVLLSNRYIDATENLVFPTNVTTLKEFTDHLDNIINRSIRHKLLLSLEPNSKGKGQIQSMIDKLYIYEEIDLLPYSTYAELFNEISFDPTLIDDVLFLDVAEALLKGSTGITNLSGNLSSPHLEMMEILRTITSYTLQYIEGDTDIDITPMDFPFLDSVSPSTTIGPLNLSSSIYRLAFGLYMSDRCPLFQGITIEATDGLLDPVISFPLISSEFWLSEGLNIIDNSPVVNEIVVRSNGLQPFVEDVIIVA